MIITTRPLTAPQRRREDAAADGYPLSESVKGPEPLGGHVERIGGAMRDRITAEGRHLSRTDLDTASRRVL